MFEEDDNETMNNNYFSEDDDENDINEINIDDDDKNTNEETSFKITSYNDILNTIQNNKKKTFPVLTKFEKTKIMGVRIQQLTNGSKSTIDTSNLHSIKKIVEEELKQRKIPFIIRRFLPNSTYEDWKLEEFEIIE